MQSASMTVLAFLLLASAGLAGSVSDKTSDCLNCHTVVSPGIVADWERSLHAKVTPDDALKKPELERRVSADRIPSELMPVVVGCAECHTMSAEKHNDTFEHSDFAVHTIVTPANCATCHPTETTQYEQNIMSHAYGNLNNNPLYRDLVNSVNGTQTFVDLKTSLEPPDEETDAESCFFCHGTDIQVKDRVTRETDFGDMEFPLLAGWPNQGVGRLNPDGTKGACTACHTRHEFSIEMARKPYTCGGCHKGPDVPAYKVYMVSKMGNIYSSMSDHWSFDSVPWVVGKDFTAPTCATCHASLLVTDDGEIVAERTHRMNDRISWRILGLIYAHPHTKSPDMSLIKNKAGLPLPTELTGEFATEHLIDEKEQAKRRESMKGVCLACHSTQWVDGHYARFDHTIGTTNEMTLTATQVLATAWEKGAAQGLPQSAPIFDEAIEKMWVEHWLFFANSIRYASAMAGADYGVFANGRWYLSKNIQEMVDWLEFKLKEKKK